MSIQFMAHVGRGISSFVAAETQRLIENDAIQNNDVYAQNIDAFDSETTVTGEEDFEDILKPLPNWNEMSLADIQRTVYYHKRMGFNGVERLVPMTKDGEKIQVREDGWVLNGLVVRDSAKDGDSIGRNEWSNDEPEHGLLNTAAKAADHLLAWGYDLDNLDSEIERLKSAICVDNAHPIHDAEDYVEILILRKQEKIIATGKPVQKLLIANFGKAQAAKIWKEMKVEIEKAVVNALDYTLDPDQIGLICCTDSNELFEKRKAIAASLNRDGEWIEDRFAKGGKRWISWHDTEDRPASAMVVMNKALKSIGGKLSKSAWVQFTKFTNAYFWGWLNGSLRGEMNEAVKGTLTRYVKANLQMEALIVWAEDNHVDRQTVNLTKTPINDVFKPTSEDYLWWNRE